MLVKIKCFTVYCALQSRINVTKLVLFQALNQVQLVHRKASAMGITHEELLLQETSSREDVLLGTISDLEAELKSLKQALKDVTEERDHGIVTASQLGATVDLLETAKRHLRAEIKELKFREARTMTDYSELEEENIMLQKQMMLLKQAQVMSASGLV